MKIDPYRLKERHEKWKQQGCVIEGISDFNVKIIVEYLIDMELGLNVKRPSGYFNLKNTRQRIVWICRKLENLYRIRKITDITEREIVSFFKEMRDGKILTEKGKPYTSIRSYAKVFCAFWRWYMKVERKKGRHILDIAEGVDTGPVKDPDFVYLEIEEVKKLATQANYDRRALIWFLFDTGIRAPTELINIKVEDLTLVGNTGIYQLKISQEISKTFERKPKLILCSNILKEYIAHHNLKNEDYIFPISPRVTNQYLQRLATRVLGKKKTKGGEWTNKITMYDFRHSAACYWRPRYGKNWEGYKYRFGWTEDTMPNYYTKFLGMKDTISHDDLWIDDEAKTKIEKELDQKRIGKNILEEGLQAQKEEMASIKQQLKKTQARDQFLEKLLLALNKNGDLGVVIDTLKEEGLGEELIALGE